MSDKEQRQRDENLEKIKESVTVTERDNADKRADAENFKIKYERLKSYRDQNKKVNENLFLPSKLKF